MTDLVSVTALGADAPCRETYGALTLVEDSLVHLSSLTLRRGQASPEPFGLALPGPGRWLKGDGIAAFWIGPDQWMIEGPGRAEEDFSRRLAAEVPQAAVTEQTDGWVCFEIVSDSGEAPLLKLLERLVNVDPAVLEPGTAVRTSLEHMSVFVVRRAEDRVAIIGMRSAAGSLWHALVTTARRVSRGI